MQYIIKEQALELIYQPGKGAWTYHLRIPNSKNIEGKWGDIKVSGSIDNYKLEKRNLAPTSGEDKILSINGEIRKAINKKGGEKVIVTLYLEKSKPTLSEQDILDTFQESDVLSTFNKLNKAVKQEMLTTITTQKNEEKQIKLLIDCIDKLTKQND
jgi:Domain of unknown function (DUF1905)